MTLDTQAPPLADRRIPKGGDWLSPDELAALTPAIVAERIRALVPMIAAASREAEIQRRPLDAVWNAIRATGYFYMFVPKLYGGLEATPEQFLDATLPMAEACASTAWAASFCVEHNLMLAHWPEETQDAVFGGSHPYIIAPGVSSPPGRATPVPGGYRVTARWKWGTGVMHSDWIIGAAMADRPGASPQAIMVLIPAEEAQVIDTWWVDGMCGTGSNDVAVEDVFVPTARTVASAPLRSGRGIGSRRYANPIYSIPMLPFLGMTASLSALGSAKSALAAFRERLAIHVRMGADTKQAEKAPAHIRMARADAIIHAAELALRQASRDVLALGAYDEPEQTPKRMEVRAHIAHAVSLCRDAVNLLSEVAGSGAHMLDNPFQRAVRDINVISSHIVFDVDAAYELHGRGMIGLPPNSVLT